MNFLEIQNCVIAVKKTMKNPRYQADFLRAICESENFESPKADIQKRMMELFPEKTGYNWASCPVWKAMLTKQCPRKEKLFNYNEKTKVYKLNSDEPITKAQRKKLFSLVGDLLK